MYLIVTHQDMIHLTNVIPLVQHKSGIKTVHFGLWQIPQSFGLVAGNAAAVDNGLLRIQVLGPYSRVHGKA